MFHTIQMAMLSQIREVPELLIQKRIKPAQVPGYDPRASYKFYYEHKSHADIPHVVKFSGGRSSGMLLVTLLENKILKPERGDVVVFNNTSAEHPATYDFVSKCKQLTESYGLPFFWIEFQTYEDSVRGEWARIPTYRLVNAEPYSAENPYGYKHKGEVFEELLSWQSYVPNQHRRTCTAMMKVRATRNFLHDWFAVKSEIGYRGHYYEKSMSDKRTIQKVHLQNGGKTPIEVLMKKKEFLMSCTPFRPAQKFGDFTTANINIDNSLLKGRKAGGHAILSNENGIEYLSFVGLRADEPHRIKRMIDRNKQDDDDDGEHLYAPLSMMGVCKENIHNFWEAQSWGLQLPHEDNLSNCVYCFLKGSKTLVNIAQKESSQNGDELTPTNIDWWREMERKYGRNLREEGRDIKNKDKAEESIIGFFGHGGMISYDKIAQRAKNGARIDGDMDVDSLPCDCTD